MKSVGSDTCWFEMSALVSLTTMANWLSLRCMLTRDMFALNGNLLEALLGVTGLQGLQRKVRVKDTLSQDYFKTPKGSLLGRPPGQICKRRQDV